MVGAMLLTVASLKGGTGKSTIAVNLACVFAVPVVDADAQGTASAYGAPGSLPIEVLSLPLDRERDASRWISKVLAIEDAVIDCPPHLRTVTEAAVALADLVVIPCTASAADLMATAGAVELVARAKEARPGDDGLGCLIVPSRIDRRTSAGREIEGALKQFGEKVGPAIGQRTVFVDAFAAGQWVGEYAPRSKATAEVSALSRAIKRML